MKSRRTLDGGTGISPPGRIRIQDRTIGEYVMYIGSLTVLGPFWMCDLRAENKH